jgi:hypothetical protein
MKGAVREAQSPKLILVSELRFDWLTVLSVVEGRMTRYKMLTTKEKR